MSTLYYHPRRGGKATKVAANRLAVLDTIRERADAATPGPWKALAEAIQRDDFEAACHYASLTGDEEVRRLALLARVDKALAETFGGERE